MAWTKEGVIAVINASTAVTGTGTAWVANAAAGEAILLPDGRAWEIASVNSDTSITLARAYTGTSLSGQAYDILPSQSYIRDLSAAAAALISSYASIYNTAGAGKFGDGTLGAPGISFVGDTNSGIARTADGTFVLVSNGVAVATISPSGMTLIETTNVAALIASGLAALSGGATVGNSTVGISSGSTSGRLRMSGGTPTDGAVVVLGGSTDGAIPSTGILAIGAVTTLSWTSAGLSVVGRVDPSAHNTYDLGTTSSRWRDLWLQSAAFNGSDARLKTPVSAMSPSEIAASRKIAAEVGTYQWLDSVAIKGAAARLHIGLTVQRAIEIMVANGLDWTRYGFIGYDAWDDVFVEHPEIAASPAVLDAAGNVIAPAVEYRAAWREQTRVAGDAYSFRYAELNQFIAAGFNARISAIEASLGL
jgi:hypothetical protein